MAGTDRCGSLSINADPLEWHVTHLLTEDGIDKLARWHGVLQETETEAARVQAEIDRREGLRVELAEERDEGIITTGEYRDRMRRNADRLRELREELTNLAVGTDDVATLIEGDAQLAALLDVREGRRDAVPDELREELRRVVAAFIERIEVRPATERTGEVDLKRVAVVPKGELLD